jgi:hypothetical protein
MKLAYTHHGGISLRRKYCGHLRLSICSGVLAEVHLPPLSIRDRDTKRISGKLTCLLALSIAWYHEKVTVALLCTMAQVLLRASQCPIMRFGASTVLAWVSHTLQYTDVSLLQVQCSCCWAAGTDAKLRGAVWLPDQAEEHCGSGCQKWAHVQPTGQRAK